MREMRERERGREKDGREIVNFKIGKLQLSLPKM